MRQCIFLISVLFTALFANGQDTIAVYKNYVIYKGDTLNRFDINGNKTGIWLTYRTDSIYQITIIGHGSGTVYESPKRPLYSPLSKGQYLNGKRQGKWTFGSDDFKKLHSEVTYNDDKLLSPILFYITDNQLCLKAEDINGKWTYYLWDEEKNSYLDTHQKYTFDLLFDGYDYIEKR
jgi:hypothetical protein